MFKGNRVVNIAVRVCSENIERPWSFYCGLAADCEPTVVAWLAGDGVVNCTFSRKK